MAGQGDAAELRLLAVLLAMPESESLDGLRDMLPAAPWLAPAVAELERLPLEHWQAEHTRLFISGYPRTPCPPFESAYRQGQMGGTTASELQGFYGRAGLTATEVPADYLGTLLECAAYLTDLAQERGEGGGDCPAAALLVELWGDHLKRWLPRFARDLAEHAGLLLYRGLGSRLARLCPEPADDV